MKRIIIILFIICIMGNVYSQVEETCFVTYMKEIQKAQGSYDYSKVIDICDKYLKGECFKQESEDKHQIIKTYKEQAEKELKKEIDKEQAEKELKKEIDKEQASKNNAVLTFSVNGVEFKMINVEGGTFTMGDTLVFPSDNYLDKTPHQVTLSSYYIGETEVTQALWQAVMGNNPSYFKGDNLPVENVRYKDIQKFIKKLNKKTGKTFRLPTEAEWEFAARGGKKSKGYEHSGSNILYNITWLSGSTTHPVKTRHANELGLYDMTGNVWEWCSDWYGDYSSDSQTNPQGPDSGKYRVCRGGSWDELYASRYRVFYRYCIIPSCSRDNLGFRLALAR